MQEWSRQAGAPGPPSRPHYEAAMAETEAEIYLRLMRLHEIRSASTSTDPRVDAILIETRTALVRIIRSCCDRLGKLDVTDPATTSRVNYEIEFLNSVIAALRGSQ
jgi:hypothetical protein